MWPDRVSNPGPPTYESDALPIALRGPARLLGMEKVMNKDLWAFGQYQSDTKIEEKVEVDS